MSPRDLVYVEHMLDMTRKAIDKTTGVTRDAHDRDENLRLALTHLVQRSICSNDSRRPASIWTRRF